MLKPVVLAAALSLVAASAWAESPGRATNPGPSLAQCNMIVDYSANGEYNKCIADMRATAQAGLPSADQALAQAPRTTTTTTTTVR
jgi:hypothetical protein